MEEVSGWRPARPHRLPTQVHGQRSVNWRRRNENIPNVVTGLKVSILRTHCVLTLQPRKACFGRSLHVEEGSEKKLTAAVSQIFNEAPQLTINQALQRPFTIPL
jgi:hypothetical protein